MDDRIVRWSALPFALGPCAVACAADKEGTLLFRRDYPREIRGNRVIRQWGGGPGFSPGKVFSSGSIHGELYANGIPILDPKRHVQWFWSSPSTRGCNLDSSIRV